MENEKMKNMKSLGLRWYVCWLLRGSNCSLALAIDSCIMRRGIISSCQSPATSKIVKRFWSRVWLMQQRYINLSFIFTIFDEFVRSKSSVKFKTNNT